MKRYLITLALVALLAVAGTVFAAPSSVDRITNRIEPLIKTDFIRAVYFVATSTTASSTFANGLNITAGCFAVNNVCITAGGGGGSGVVNPGTQGQNAFYDSTGATVSGTSTIFVSTASNVGIGTTTPTSKLSVIGSISGDSVNTTSTTATSTFLGKLQVGTYAGVPQIVGPDIDTGIHFDGPDIFSVHTGGTPKFLINSLGNVGIGTTSPYAKLAVVGDVVAATVNATSTTATSTFQGNVLIGPTGRFPKGFTNGTNFVLNDTYVGPFQGVVVNDSTSNFAIASWFLGNDKYVPNEFLSAYYCGMAMASSNYDVPGFNGLKPNGAAFFCKDGDITVGTGTTTGTIRLQAGGLDADQVDVVITGVNGNMGVGTTSPYAKLSVHPRATDIQRTLFAIASSTATATTTHMVVLNTGQVGIGTTSPTSGSLLDVDGIAYVGRNSGTSAQLVVEGGSGGTTMFSLRRTSGANATYDWSLSGGCLSFSDGVAAATTMSICGDAGFDEMNLGGRNRGASTTRADWIKAKSFSASAGTDVPGVTFNIQGSLGTGAGTTGNIRFLTANQGSSGTTQQTSSERMIIMGNTGNVGVGTTTPGARLAVTESGSTIDSLVVEDQAADPNPFRIDTNGNLFIHASSTQATTTQTGATPSLTIFPSNTNGQYLDSAFLFAANVSGNRKVVFEDNRIQVNFGDNFAAAGLNLMPYLTAGSSGVGIGTTTNKWPASLTIQGTTTSASNATLATFNSAGTRTFTVTDAGNVGVGSTTPGRTLAVAGAALMTGTTTSAGVDLTSGCYAFNGECNSVKKTFTYSTTTAWTGTTTLQLGPAYENEFWSNAKCYTDTGTVNVVFKNGTNAIDLFNASTTVGTVTFTTNRGITASTKRSVDIGTPASSPTSISCTAKYFESK